MAAGAAPPHARVGVGMGTVLLWVFCYLLACGVVPAALGLLWGGSPAAPFLDLLAAFLLNAAFLALLLRRAAARGARPRLLGGRPLRAAALGAGLALLFYLVLDLGLDPLLARAFPASQAAYAEGVASLLGHPLMAALQVCLLAPVVEETFMRGCVLGALRPRCGTAVALGVSSVLFALLHFNFLQTLSALVCGLCLGGLYLATGSLLGCMVAHMLYNTLSLAALLWAG